MKTMILMTMMSVMMNAGNVESTKLQAGINASSKAVSMVSGIGNRGIECRKNEVREIVEKIKDKKGEVIEEDGYVITTWHLFEDEEVL